MNRWLLSFLTASFAIALPCIGLCCSLNTIFGIDWQNTLWFINNQAHSIRHTGAFPFTCNTTEIIGVINPIIYGWGCYPYLAILSFITGPALALRLAVVGAFYVQYFHVLRMGRKLALPYAVRHGIAIFLTWAIYPLCNIYKRGAFAEFLAVCFLTAAISCLLTLLASREEELTYEKRVCGLLFALAAAMHPITGLYGGILFAMWSPLLLLKKKRQHEFFKWLAWTAVAIVAFLSPWLYLVASLKSGMTTISNSPSLARYTDTFFTHHWYTGLMARLAPFPLNWMALNDESQALCAQASLPLVLLAGFFVVVSWRHWFSSKRSADLPRLGVLVTAMVLFVLILIASSAPELSRFSIHCFGAAQFPYRFVTYLNLTALAICALTMAEAGRLIDPQRLYAYLLFGVCLGISLSSMLEIQPRAKAISTKIDPALDIAPDRLPWVFYGINDYTVPGQTLDVPATTIREVALRVENDRVLPAEVTMERPGWVRLNIAAFPWGLLFIDGQKVADDARKSVLAPLPGTRQDRSFVQEAHVYAIRLPAGTHRISYEFHPDRLYLALRYVSHGVLLIWIAYVLLPLIGACLGSSRCSAGK